MAGSTRSNRVQYNCSFCGKSQDQVKRLIAGPGSVYICNECVESCNKNPMFTEVNQSRVKEKGEKILNCSFCNIGQYDVEKLIADPNWNVLGSVP